MPTHDETPLLWGTDEEAGTDRRGAAPSAPLAPQPTQPAGALSALGDATGLVSDPDPKIAHKIGAGRRALDLYMKSQTGGKTGLGSFGAPMRMIENLMKGDDLGEAMFRTGAQEGMAAGLRSHMPNASAAGRSGSLVTNIAQIVDPFIPDDWGAVKDTTATVAAADPIANLLGAGDAIIDAVGGVISGDGEGMQQTLDTANAGGYSPTIQAMTLWNSVLGEKDQMGSTSRWVTNGGGAKSSRLLKIGNDIGDAMFNNDGTVGLSEAYENAGMVVPEHVKLEEQLGVIDVLGGAFGLDLPVSMRRGARRNIERARIRDNHPLRDWTDEGQKDYKRDLDAQEARWATQDAERDDQGDRA